MHRIFKQRCDVVARRFWDVKEAVAAAAPRRDGVGMPRDNAQRALEGARHVAPMPGNRMSTARLDGSAVFVRELTLQDLKLDAEGLTEADAVEAARYLALVIGQAHAGQMDAESRRTWLAQPRKDRSKSAVAPPWVWRSIVELLVARAYLTHCRCFALDRPVR